MRGRALWTAAVAALLSPACVLADVDLTGRPCPCTDGYSCDAATDTCVKGDTGATTSGSTSAASTTSSAVTSGSGAGGEGGESSVSTGGGSSSGGGGSAPGPGGTGGDGGAGGQGGTGGAEGCVAPLVPADVPCGGLTDSFDDAAAFATAWTVGGSPDKFIVDGGQLTIAMAASEVLSARTATTFDFDACSIWMRLVSPSEDAGVMARLSYGTPGGGSQHNIGVKGTFFQARLGDAVQVQLPYDPETMRYFRMRAADGLLHYGISADGACWDEVFEVPLTTPMGVEGRLVLIRYDGAAGANQATFDDFGLIR